MEDTDFDDLARLAAEACDVPIALVSLVDERRQWFKSHIGLDARETPRELAFCAHAILGSAPLVVPDATNDPRFADNPLVTGPPHVGSYAGVPLLDAGGFALGTLCAIDHVPRELTQRQLRTLGILARQVARLLDLRASLRVAESSASEMDGFFSLSLDLLCIANTEGHFTRLNPAWEQTLGYSIEELLGRPFLEFVHPDEQAATANEVAKVAAGGATTQFEVRFRHRDGGHRWLRWSAVSSHDRRQMYAAARDVTELVESGTALAASRARLAGVLNAAVDGIVSINERGRVNMVNPATCRLFGYREDELVGQNVKILMPEPYRREHDGYLEHHLTTGETKVIGKGRDVVGRRKDGTTFPVYLAVGEIADQSPREFVGILQDISTRQAAQERLEAQSEDLAKATAQATSANRMKSEFLANMSHELRTPLNGILGFGRLLRDAEVGPVNDEQKEFLGHIVTSGEHLLQLINDILDLSKVDAGKLDFNPVPLETQLVINEICGVVREVAAKKRVRLTIEVSADVANLVLDPARLKQVLYNYVSNAIKASSAENTIWVRALPEGDDRVRFEVEDTGVGIGTDDLALLFQEFRQLDQSASKKQQGTGLGLALTKRLVEAQGGEIGVASELGKGSVFFAVLPRRSVSRDADVEGPPSPNFDRVDHDSTIREDNIDDEAARTVKVLVVEDDKRERAWLRRTLGEAGFIVDVAGTGDEALRAAAARRYDALTLDVFLPDMTGLEVLAAIRKGGPNRDTPVVVVTVVADKGIAIGYRIREFITKPTSPEELVGALSRVGVTAGRQRVLIVDDDPVVRDVVRTVLDPRGFLTVFAENGAVGLAAVRRERPAVVILDLMMPVLDGFGFLRELRQLDDGSDIPVIVWSSKDLTNEERAQLQATAQAIVLKGAGAGEVLVDAVSKLLRTPS